ncbi:MAG: protein kinase domain-containing protein [Nannocystales bacterium]
MVPQVQPHSLRTLADVSGTSYEVLGRLATGGMAELFLARARAGGDAPSPVVVLKKILPHLAADPEFVRMFRDEAHLALALQHHNIVRAIAIGEAEDFFTMEYVHGETLRAVLDAAQSRGENIPLPQVLSIALGISSGLHHTHQQTDGDGRPLHIVHRDVSPSNVLVGYDGAVKLVDFGVAKAAAGTHVTQAGTLKGKLSYMSPEQCRAEHVDHRSDVFALGILLYEATTLTRLFAGDNEVAVLNQVISSSIEPPSSRRRGYPPALERIVLRALRADPDDRYQSAEALRLALVKFGRHLGLRPTQDGLARYVRGLFGDKPLPWSEIAGVPTAQEGNDQTVPLHVPEQHTEVAVPAPERRAGTTRVADIPTPSAGAPVAPLPPRATYPTTRSKFPMWAGAAVVAVTGLGLGATMLREGAPPQHRVAAGSEPELEPAARGKPRPTPEPQPTPAPEPEPTADAEIEIPPEFRMAPEPVPDPEFVLIGIEGEERQRQATIKLRDGSTVQAALGASVGHYRVVAVNARSVLLEQRDAGQSKTTVRLEL